PASALRAPVDRRREELDGGVAGACASALRAVGAAFAERTRQRHAQAGGHGPAQLPRLVLRGRQRSALPEGLLTPANMTETNPTAAPGSDITAEHPVVVLGA